jgi:hypothetical protein
LLGLKDERILARVEVEFKKVTQVSKSGRPSPRKCS